MKRRISTGTYRLIDLSIFALILFVFENLIVRAARVWYADQLYTVSVTAAVTAIVMMRWGAWGLIHAALGGLIFALANGGSAEQIAVYGMGNLFAAAGLLVRRFLGREKITGDGVRALLYAVAVQVSMQAGRAAVAILFGGEPRNCLGFFTTDSLSILFTMLIVWIARRQDGLLEDQGHYLRRLRESEEREEEPYRRFEQREHGKTRPRENAEE